MQLLAIDKEPKFEVNSDLEKSAFLYQGLLDAIAKKDVPTELIREINEHTRGINAATGTPKALEKTITRHQNAILKTLEKQLKIVPQSHYQTQFLAIGMAAFGIPIGLVFGTILGNMGFLGIGLPIGMALGIALGGSKDKKAASQGLQLDWKPN